MIMKNTQDLSTIQTISTMLLTTGPFILMLGVIAFILYLMINYKSIILDNHVSSLYNSFSNITVMLILIQLYFVYTNISTDIFETTGKISKVTANIIYLLGILSGISTLVLYVVLKYFTTDGFVSII
jgi:hypothetical protein